jgi:hypothetical protein
MLLCEESEKKKGWGARIHRKKSDDRQTERIYNTPDDDGIRDWLEKKTEEKRNLPTHTTTIEADALALTSKIAPYMRAYKK